MTKSKKEVIAQFNEEVNMSVEELEEWLKDPKSKKAGTGVGIESGHKIIEILRKNPDKDPEKYDEEDIEHMRKVVSYAKRHLAQEDHLKETKTREELDNTKSTISLKNWGHDPVKAMDEENGANSTSEENIASEEKVEEVQSDEASSQDAVVNGGEGSDEKAGSENQDEQMEQEVIESQTQGKGEDIDEETLASKPKKRKLDEDREDRPAEEIDRANGVEEGHEETTEAQESEASGPEDPPSKKCKVDEA